MRERSKQMFNVQFNVNQNSSVAFWFPRSRMGDRDSDSTHTDISNQNISVGDELNFFKITKKSGRVTHHFHHGLYRLQSVLASVTDNEDQGLNQAG